MLFCHNTKYKLFLTNKAKKRIKQLVLNDINMIGLRIDIKKSGCAGFGYVFKKVVKQNWNENDIIFEYGDKIKIFISPKIAPFVNESELDYIEDNLNYMFRFKNPNVHHLCGCGESFNM